MSHPDLIIAMNQDQAPVPRKQYDPYHLCLVLRKLGHHAAAEDLQEWLVKQGVR